MLEYIAKHSRFAEHIIVSLAIVDERTAILELEDELNQRVYGVFELGDHEVKMIQGVKYEK